MPTKEEMKNFSVEIDRFVSERNINHLEAIVEYCSETGLEMEVAATLINSNLKSKIELLASDLNMLKVKKSRLPI
jgi:hypothetical protein